MVCDVRAARPITQVFGQLFFTAVWTRYPRLDRHFRHMCRVTPGMPKFLPTVAACASYFPVDVKTKVTLRCPRPQLLKHHDSRIDLEVGPLRAQGAKPARGCKIWNPPPCSRDSGLTIDQGRNRISIASRVTPNLPGTSRSPRGNRAQISTGTTASSENVSTKDGQRKSFISY